MDDINKTQPWRSIGYWKDKLSKNPTLTVGDAMLFRAALHPLLNDPQAKSLDDFAKNFLSQIPGANEKCEEFFKEEAEVNSFQESFEQIKNLLPYAKNLFDEQKAFLAAHGDSSPQNYLEMLDLMGKAMVDEKLNSEKRIEHAKNVLKLIKIHEDTIGKPLGSTIVHLQVTLTQIEKYLKNLDKLKSEGKLRVLFEEPNLANIIRLNNDWSDAAYKLYQSRLIQVNYIHKHEIWNKDLPNKIIETQGSLEFKVPITYFEDKIRDTAEFKSALDQDSVNYKNLMDVHEQLFGRGQTQVIQPSTNSAHQSSISKKPNKIKGIVISLGVVILGLIVVGLGAEVFGYVISLFGVVYGIKIIWKG